MNLDWLRNRNWLKKTEAPGGDIPVGPPASFKHPYMPPFNPRVTASKATAKQPRRYQDRSKYLGPQWGCIKCNYNNEGVICTHCGYVPEGDTPVPMGKTPILERFREVFSG